MKKIFLIFVFWFLLIITINKLSVNLIPDRTSYELPFKVPFTFTVAPLLNMDGGHYLDIACNGYFVKGGFDLRVFFPVYPLLVRTLSLNCTINPIIVGLLISAASFLASLYILARMVSQDFRFKTLLLLLFFPTSFFFAAYYTESVFFLFVVLTFWFLSKKDFLKSSLAAAIASATRVFGLALTPALIFEGYKYYKKTGRFPLAVLLSPLGFIVYSAYSWLQTNNFFVAISSQEGWQRSIDLLAPLTTLKYTIESALNGPLPTYDSPFVYPVILVEFATLLFIIAILYFSYKKIEMSHWIYVLGTFLIILFGGQPSSSPRYALVLFPAYIFLAKKLTGAKYIIYLICSLALFIFMASVFLRGYWSS